MDIQTIKDAIFCPVPSISTPFTRDGEIDWGGVDRIVEFSIENGAKSLLLTNGDSLMTVLSDTETEQLLKRVVRQARGRAAVLAGGKAWGTGRTLDYLEFAREAGADVGMILFADWAQSAGVDEMAALTAAAGRILPVMLMTNLGNGRGVPMPLFRRLIDEKVPGFCGVKDDMVGAYGRRLAVLLDGKYAFLSGGRAENHLDAAPYGADGYLSIYMRVRPALAWQYWDHWLSGDVRACAKWIRTYEMPLLDLAANEGLNLDLLIHALMEIEGLCGRWRRAPYQSASDEQMEKIRAFWTKLTGPGGA